MGGGSVTPKETIEGIIAVFGTPIGGVALVMFAVTPKTPSIYIIGLVGLFLVVYGFVVWFRVMNRYYSG